MGGVCSKIKKNRSTIILLLLFGKTRQKETVILVCGSKKSKAESGIAESNSQISFFLNFELWVFSVGIKKYHD